MSSRTVSQVVLGVVSLAIGGALVAGFVWGLPTFLIGLAAGALSLVIVLMWASLQQMEEDGEMEFEQALSYAAPSAEEEQKRALLRTLKDLEYELSVGKISREDYDLVCAEVREKAKRMIALTDEVMKEKLEAAEKRVTAHLREEEAKEAAEARKKPEKKSKKRRTQSEPSEDSTYESGDEIEPSAKEAGEGDETAVTDDQNAKSGDEAAESEDEVRS